MTRKEFRRARKTVDVSVGESVRIIRELQELSQSQLSDLTGIPQSTISAIENDRDPESHWTEYQRPLETKVYKPDVMGTRNG